MIERTDGFRTERCALPALILVAAWGLALSGGALAQSPAGTAAPAINGVGTPFELAFWDAVAKSEDRAQFEAYLAQYPNGTFSALAKAKIAALDRAKGVAPAAPAPAAVPVPAPAKIAAPAASATMVASPAAPEGPAPVAEKAVAAPVAAAPAMIPAVATSAAPSPAADARSSLAAFPAMASKPAPSAPPAQGPVAAAVPAVAAPAAAVAPAATDDPFAKLAAMRARAASASAATAAPAAEAAPLAAPAALAAARPQLAAVPVIQLPSQFCSAEERNRFHDSIYKPAMAVADANNKAVIFYMDKLQADYDARSSGGEVAAANAIAREAGEYRPLAEQAYAERTSFLGLFDKMMAVPIATCVAGGS